MIMFLLTLIFQLLLILFFKSSPKDMFIDFRERGRARQRNLDGRERNINHFAPCTCPNWGSSPQPSYMP